MSEKKLCVDCAHYKAPPASMKPALHATCKRFRQPPSLVDGSEGAPRLCDAVRQYEDLCGPLATGFEPIRIVFNMAPGV